MDPVTSVAAFVALHPDGVAEGDAGEIFDRLDPEERLALRSWAVGPSERLDWLQRNSDRPWTQAQLEHLEARAAVHVRRELQRRGWWRA